MKFNIKKYIPCLRKIKSSIAPLQAIEGHEEYRLPLPVTNISYMFFPLNELTNSTNINLISEELNIDLSVIKDDINRLITGMRTDLTCCLEYPYVEEYYRDSYYSFYSRKHHSCNRNCFRLSFFDSSVNEFNYYEINLSGKYYGYTVFRPTPKRIIGYTFLSPLIYVENDFSICCCKRTVSIMGKILEVTGFPFCGQDGEMNSCAENAIVIMFDYFSRRYNKYSRVLPSQIALHLSDYILNRKQPSIGLDMDTAFSIIGNLGMATRRYTKQDNDGSIIQGVTPENFINILYIYIESGIPIYASSSTHAFLIIGRENKYFDNGAKVVCMNDSERPYSLLESVENIDDFIVPVPENILLNAEHLNFKECIEAISQEFSDIEFLKQDEQFYHRVYLTTSRSYKAYIANSNLSIENKIMVTSIAMPRFVWVCEFCSMRYLTNDIKSIIIDLIVVLDATDYPFGCNHLLLVKTKEKMIVPDTDETRLQRKIYSIFDSNEPMFPFMNNLKGGQA